VIKKLSIFFITLFLGTPIFAKSVDTAWVRVYSELDEIGGDSYGIAVDNDGNVYVTGYADSGGKPNFQS
jgi:hypothetical protein